MQEFFTVYDLVDWIICDVAADTLVVGGAAYVLLTLRVLKPGSNERLGLELFSMRTLFYSASARVTAPQFTRSAFIRPCDTHRNASGGELILASTKPVSKLLEKATYPSAGASLSRSRSWKGR